MMIDTRLHEADPARGLEADARSDAAQALLARIVATPSDHRPSRRSPVTRPSARRIAVGVACAAAAAVAALLAPMPWRHGPGTPSAAYAVTTGAGGAVHVSVQWDRLRDPAALQAALDRAGARVDLRVVTDGRPEDCLASARTVGYTDRAVRWQSPGRPQGGFTVHPGEFPAHGTFVVTVVLAPEGTTGRTTFAPSQPQLEAFSASMVIGRVPPCAR
jgi:hypothetical protein